MQQSLRMTTPRIGRWTAAEDGEVTLHGNRCNRCGEITFPEREFCPRCRSTDLAAADLRGPVKLLSYTVVHQAPAGFATPMAVGYGVFPDGDAVVLAPIDAPAERLRKGMKLRVIEGVTSTSADGAQMMSYRYAELPDA
jgi:uncharacterized OB-fold protein